MIKGLSYKQHLTDAMNEISMMDNSIFIGQGVKDGGHGISPTLEEVEENLDILKNQIVSKAYKDNSVLN